MSCIYYKPHLHQSKDINQPSIMSTREHHFSHLYTNTSHIYCVTINKQIQILYVGQSLTPTTSASVELLVFIFCLLGLKCTIPYPKDMHPPVCIFRSGCTTYSAWTHVHNWLILSAPIIILSYMGWYILIPASKK